MTFPEDKAIQPQEGPQREFLECDADVAIYGGAAGGGKSVALLLDPLRAVSDPDFRGAIFRRESVQITSGGGLWDTSDSIYTRLKASSRAHPRHEWEFQSGARVEFHHLQHEKSKKAHQGAQYTFIGFDELTHFTESQWVYLMSRNRSAGATEPWMRATCNPDGSSWVYKWVKPFLKSDGKTPDPDECGTIKYFTIDNGTIRYVDQDWRDEDGDPPRTITFIPAKLEDNPALTESDPKYAARLRSQSKSVRDRLKKGLWVTEQGKMMFRHHRIRLIDEEDVPSGLSWVRYWDLADTEVPLREQDPHDKNGPDWTAGALCALWYPPKSSDYYDEDRHDPILIVQEVDYFQLEGDRKDDRIRNAAVRDGKDVVIGMEREGGSSGKYVARDYEEGLLSDFSMIDDRPTGEKVERAKPWRRLAERERVWFVDGEWVAQAMWWIDRFPSHKKDVIDAISGAHKVLTSDEFEHVGYEQEFWL